MIHNGHSKVDKHFLFTSINQNICNMYKLMKLLLKYYFTKIITCHSMLFFSINSLI